MPANYPNPNRNRSTVQTGDNWFTLASRYLGNQALAGYLANANPGIYSLRPGMSVQLPRFNPPAPTPTPGPRRPGMGEVQRYGQPPSTQPVQGGWATPGSPGGIPGLPWNRLGPTAPSTYRPYGFGNTPGSPGGVAYPYQPPTANQQYPYRDYGNIIQPWQQWAYDLLDPDLMAQGYGWDAQRGVWVRGLTTPYQAPPPAQTGGGGGGGRGGSYGGGGGGRGRGRGGQPGAGSGAGAGNMFGQGNGYETPVGLISWRI